MAAQRDYVLHDFERFMAERTSEKFWLVFTGLNSHWGYLGRNQPEIIERYLDDIGCRKAIEQHLANETVKSSRVPTGS
jgi:hypothetical protein